MKQEDTKQRILDKALELFSAKGYDSVSVGEIAKAVGIKAPSLYNHFPSKQAIFDAIVESTAVQYESDTDKIDIHVQDVQKDIPIFAKTTEDALFEKVRQIFEYSLHNETISGALFGAICGTHPALPRRYFPCLDCIRRDQRRRSGGACHDVCRTGADAHRCLRPPAGKRTRVFGKAPESCPALFSHGSWRECAKR